MNEMSILMPSAVLELTFQNPIVEVFLKDSLYKVTYANMSLELNNRVKVVRLTEEMKYQLYLNDLFYDSTLRAFDWTKFTE